MPSYKLVSISIALILLLSIGTTLTFSVNANSTTSHTIAFLIESPLYDKIENSLGELFKVLKPRGYHFVIENITTQNPDEIRSVLKWEYQNYGIEGAVLIGNIPLKSYYNNASRKTIEFPYYYMNLDGNWLDEDGDGIIDTPPENYLPDIWVGLVRSTDMDGNNATQINRYIWRAISYLKGEIIPEPKSIGFLDDDFVFLNYDLYWSLLHTYGYADVYPAKYPGMSEKNTNKSTFLNTLSQPYAYGFFVVHSNGEHYYLKVSNRWKYVYPSEIKSRILFYTDLSCYGASFSKGAIANYLIMGENAMGLGVLSFTSEGYINRTINNITYYHLPIGEGKSFGEALLCYITNISKRVNDFNGYGAMLTYLGFPFLKPWRPNGYKEIPPLKIGGNDELLSYAKTYGWMGEGSKEDPIRIENMMIFTPLNSFGLTLTNVTLHVKISDCFILVNSISTGLPTPAYGIKIENSENVVVENNQIYHGALYVVESKDITIQKNRIEDAFSSIYLLNSSRIYVRYNAIKNGSIDCKGAVKFVNGTEDLQKRIYYAENINISYNRIENFSGISLRFVRNSTVFRNQIKFTSIGLKLFMSIYNRIIENNFTLYFIPNNTLSIPTFYVFLYESRENCIYRNNFFYSEKLPEYIDFHTLISIGCEPFSSHPYKMVNYWNSTRYGNYWQWWAEKNDTNDMNNDSIVDYPFVMDENNTDYKPLKEPVTWKIEKEEQGINWFFYIALGVVVSIAVLIGAVLILRRKR